MSLKEEVFLTQSEPEADPVFGLQAGMLRVDANHDELLLSVSTWL